MEGLGIDWRLLLIQTINFLILFFVLKKWVYPPLIKFLEARAQKIQESLAASEKMRSELKSFELEKEKERQKMAGEAQLMLERVRTEAAAEKGKIIESAKVQAGNIVVSAQAQIENEKQKTKREAARETIDLSIKLARKIVSSLSEDEARSLIDKALENESSDYVQSRNS